MIPLFNIPKPNINLEGVDHILHSEIVTEFEKEFAEFVGAKYAVGVCSCTMAIYLTMVYLKNHMGEAEISTMTPPVVANALIHSGIKWHFTDSPDWVGGPYHLYGDSYNWIVVDSAQAVWKDQCEFSPGNVFLYSFYPTKPVGGIDGGMIVSNNEDFIG